MSNLNTNSERLDIFKMCDCDRSTLERRNFFNFEESEIGPHFHSLDGKAKHCYGIFFSGKSGSKLDFKKIVFKSGKFETRGTNIIL